MISFLKKEIATLSNKERFIKMIIDKKLNFINKKKINIVQELYDLNFDTQSFLNQIKININGEINEFELENNNNIFENDENEEITDSEEESENEEDNNGEDNINDNYIKLKALIREYDYLLKLNLLNLTERKIKKILKEKELKNKELSILEKTEIEKYFNEEEEENIIEQKQKLNNESSVFKIPLNERIKEKSINIGNCPLPFEALNYGPSAKRNERDDIYKLNFNDKEKIK